MEKKKSVKSVILTILVILIATALVIVPFALEKMKDTGEDKGSVLSSTASLASISKTVSGAGTLTDEDAVDMKLPYGVEVTKYLVSNNDFVTEGQALAEVDRITIMNSIKEYQEDLEYVETQMALYTDTGAENFLTTSSAGRVMELYANVGDNINDVMLEHGALALLSLDGLLAVDIYNDTIPVGSSVGVVAPDGSIVSGHVESKKDGFSVITLSQDDRAVGEEVNIINEYGETLGIGELYVHSPLRISGYSGVIEAVHVKINQDMFQGGTIFTYSGNSNSAEYDVYAAKHTELAEYVADLFKMYTDGTVNAKCAGVVSGIDEDEAAELLAATGEQKAALDFLTNVTTLENNGAEATPTALSEGYPKVYYESGKVNYMVTNFDAATKPGNSWINILRTDHQYSDRLSAINAVSSANWNENMSFEQLNNYGVDTQQISESNIGNIIFVFEYYCESADTYRLNSVAVEVSGLTVWASTTAEKTDDSTPVLNKLANSGKKLTVQTIGMEGTPYYRLGKVSGVTLNDDGTGNAVYSLSEDKYYSMDEVVYAIQTGIGTMHSIGTPLTVPSYGVSMSNVMTTGSYLLVTYIGGQITEYEEPGYIAVIDSMGNVISSGGGGGGGTGGGSSGGMTSNMSSSASVEKAYEYYPTKQTTIMSVTPQDLMTVDITVDELDILSIQRGQDVQITLDALAGQAFDGVITDIGVSGSNSGGNTKYTAEVTIERASNMIAGMNATALITLSTSENLVTIPTEAIVCEGVRDYVYTSYDEKNDVLGNPVDVTTGASDGILTEIKTGLKEGDTVWYNYFDKLDNDFDFNNMPSPPDFG